MRHKEIILPSCLGEVQSPRVVQSLTWMQLLCAAALYKVCASAVACSSHDALGCATFAYDIKNVGCKGPAEPCLRDHFQTVLSVFATKRTPDAVASRPVILGPKKTSAVVSLEPQLPNRLYAPSLHAVRAVGIHTSAPFTRVVVPSAHCRQPLLAAE